MLRHGEHQALGGLLGIDEVMHGVDGDAEGVKAEDEHKTEGCCPSGSTHDPTEPDGAKEEQCSQEQTRSAAVIREWLGRRDVYKGGKLSR
jgi:hypothetical protein